MCICPFCAASVDDLGHHYGRDCEPVAVAFGDFWPFKEADAAIEYVQ